MLSNVIQPVSLVDSDISLNAAVSSPLLNTPFTQGVQTAPAAATLLADTGPFAVATNITATIIWGALIEGSGTGIEIVRRNAANNADVWSQELANGIAVGQSILTLFLVMLAGERLIVRQGAQNGTAGSKHQASIWIS
jgi:hypothetical protein